MTTYTVLNLVQDLNGIMHGAPINDVLNFTQFNLVNRSASQLLLDCDPQETIKTLPIVNAVYSKVFDYPIPDDLKGNKVINIFPQVNQKLWDVFVQAYNQDFNVGKNWTTSSNFTILFNSGLKTIGINWFGAQNGQVVNTADSIQNNGTWFTGGSANNLTVDNVNFVSGNGSLKFDLANAGSSGFLEDNNMGAVNLSANVFQSVLFLYTFLPIGADFTSVELRWGSSSTDYYTQTATLTQQNTSFIDGWNLLQFPWETATTVGTPNPANITYTRVVWNYNGTQQIGVRLDNIVSRLGSILNMEYYSKYLFRDAITGAFKERATSLTDFINLDTEAYNLLLYIVAAFAAQQQSGVNSSFDYNLYWQNYQTNLKKYTTMYKSQVSKPHTVYYKMPNRSFKKFFRNW